jgi:hypothetical protein
MNAGSTQQVPLRVVWLLVLAVVSAMVAMVLFPGQTLAAWPVLTVELGVLLVWVAAALGLGRWFRSGVLRVAPTNIALDLATDAALGLGALSLATFLLGSAGWLNRPVAAGLLSVGLVAFGREVVRHRNAIAANVRCPAAWWLLAACPFPVVMLLSATVLSGVLWGDEPHGYDVVSYHLQLPREWFELGRITTLDHNVFSFFPLNVEMQFLLAMHLRGGPWAGMYLAQLVCAAMMLITAAGVFGVLRPAGVRAASCGAVVFLAFPWTTLLGSVAYNEAGLILWSSLAAFRVLYRADRGNWMLAGILAGLALGTKYTAAITLVAAMPAVMLPTRGAHSKHLAMFIVVALGVASPWLVRNAVATGNPVFPMAMDLLGSGHFDAGQVERWDVAHSPRDDQRSIASRLDALRVQVLADWRYGGVVVVVALATVAVVRSRTRPVLALAMLVVVSIGFWLGATHLQGRFLVHVLPWLAVLAVTGMGSRFAPVLTALCVVLGLVFWHGRFELISRLGVTPVLTIGLMPAPDLNDIILPEAVVRVVRGTSRPVALAGDARAFWYVMPMSRLSYRTVFDVPSSGDSLERAWTKHAPADAMVIVDPNELRRFARTYRHLPAFTGREQQPFILPADR